jgi:hypothetical protein
MSILKSHEWKYLKSTSNELFLTEIGLNASPYFIYLEGDVRVEKGVMDPPDPETYALATPEVEKNVVTIGDNRKVQLGYHLKWRA